MDNCKSQVDRLISAGFVPLDLNFNAVYALVWQKRIVYIGKSTCFPLRIQEHIRRLRRWRKGLLPKVGEQPVFQFDTTLIMRCKKEELTKLEYQMINHYRPEYNIASRSDLIAIGVGKNRTYMRYGPLDITIDDMDIKPWKTEPVSFAPNYLRR